MAVFDRKKIKNNFLPIVIMGAVVLLFVFLEIFSDDIETKLKNLDDKDINISKLVINEIMTSNNGAYVDINGNEYDWIELYNGSNHDIDLSNYTLSDEESGNAKWIFPNVTIKSKEHMIIYLSSTVSEGLYVNFALNKAGGELVTLKKPNGKVVDSVRTVAIDKNTVMARNSNGDWITTNDITPGYSNNEEGRKKYLANLSSDHQDIIINEFLTNNKGNTLINNQFYGYIEIKNISKNDVNLRDYYLSHDINRPYLWKLPDKVLKAGEIYLFYTSELDNETNTSFSLKKKNGVVILAKQNKIVEKIEYKNINGGYAFIKNDNNEFIEATNISPGYPNTTAGVAAFLEEQNKNKKDLIISEAMSSNNKYLAQNGNEYYDWIEIYNNSGKTINLSDYSLTTDEETKSMYKLENKELKAGEYYIVMASGNTSYSNSKYKHANFKISPTESIYLYKGNEIIDAMFISNIPSGYSYGRNNKNGFYYFATPTPGSSNKSGVAEISYAPIMSSEPGIYNDIKNLTVEIKGSGTIYYTLDGSEPTKNSKVYNSPLVLSKTTVVRAISFESGKKASQIITASYIINEKHTMPVLSLSLPPLSFKTISNNPSSNFTMKAHAELYEDGKSFSIDCGMKLFGGQTRFIPKKSFSLKFNTKYGPSDLEYKVFDNRDATTYSTLVIRSGSQDSIYSMMRDELATSIMDDYGTVDVQAYKPVILYINGSYWGIYYIREKVDEEFVENHYDVDGANTNIMRVDGENTVGSNKFYINLSSYIRTHDMSKSESYEYVKTKLDIENFIDFWIGQLYVTNNDIVNMRFFNNPNVDNGKIKMIYYDFDWAFYNYSRDYLRWMTNPNGLGEWGYDNVIIRNLMTNKEFKKDFLERLSYNMKNVWTDENVMNRYNELYEILKPEMARNQKRWGYTMNDWDKGLKELKNYIQKRRSNMLSNIKSYFGLTSEEMKKYFE
jgi:CotH protein.